MLRNLMVIGVVSLVMGLTTLASRSLAPPSAQLAMEGEPRLSQDETTQAWSRPMPNQSLASQSSSLIAQTAQSSQMSPAASGPMNAGMMGGGQAGGNMMMCPCMAAMMGGSMSGGAMAGPTSGSAAATEPISNPRTKDQARQRAQQHLEWQGNPNLKAGEVVHETAASYEIDVVTTDGSLVNRLIIEKQSGEIKTQY